MRVSVLIPCHNEEKSIAACVKSAVMQSVKPDEIVVVNDGSTDSSPRILKKLIQLREYRNILKIINIYPATGNKSYAQEEGLKHVTGEVFIATDGDTEFHPDFIKNIQKDFLDPQVAAVGGYVKSLKYNWLTAARAYDYTIGQDIHKSAQDALNYVFVIPGAAGAFRTSLFRKYVKFDHDTLTEDLDFTYKLHKNNLKIKYNRRAIVFTQDPPTIHSYVNQMRRWFGGGFQNLRKHLGLELVEDPRRTLELSLIYIEGLFFSVLLFLIPILNLSLALRYFALLLLLITVQAVYVAVKEKRGDVMIVPLIYLPMMFVNAWLFLEQFVREIILKRKNLVWFHPERVAI